MEQAGDVESAMSKALQLEEILLGEKKVTKSKKRRLRRKKLEAFRKQAAASCAADDDWEDCSLYGMVRP